MQQTISIDDELLNNASQCLSMNDVNKLVNLALRELIENHAISNNKLRALSTGFMVNVTVFDNIWTAECNELGLVTEANSYNELIEKAWDIAPELAELNGLGNAVNNIKLQFIHDKASH